jgi:hypothetical protein
MAEVSCSTMTPRLPRPLIPWRPIAGAIACLSRIPSAA